jgi:hypothetical protein
VEDYWSGSASFGWPKMSGVRLCGPLFVAEPGTSVELSEKGRMECFITSTFQFLNLRY